MADPFSLNRILDAVISTVYTSDEITVSGLSAPVTATVTNGTIVLNSTDTGLTSTSVDNGDLVAIKLTSSANYSTSVYSTLTIDDQSDLGILNDLVQLVESGFGE